MKPGVPDGRKPPEGPGGYRREDFGQRVKAHIRYFYETDEVTPDGSKLKVFVPGVTTVLNELGGDDYLIGWANRLGLEGIDNRLYMHAAGRVGTLAHDLIERQLDGKEYSLREWSEDEQERATYSVNAFLNWKRGKQITFIPGVPNNGIELPLVSRKHGFGGKLDLYAMVDGIRTLWDIKSSRFIGLSHKCQVTAYSELLVENGYERPEQFMLIRVGRDEPTVEAEVHELKQDKMPLYWRLFLNCLDNYKIKKELKER